jgi:hypothetical protein
VDQLRELLPAARVECPAGRRFRSHPQMRTELLVGHRRAADTENPHVGIEPELARRVKQ